MNIRVLITGCSGFVGENIVNYFLQHTDDTTIIGIDRHRPNITNNRFQFLQVDLCKDAINEIDNVDLVLHLAGQPSVWFAENNFSLDFDLNLRSTISVLDFVIKQSLPLIFLSTIAIYQDNDRPLTEVDLGTQTTWYGLSKLTCEQYCLFAARKYGFHAIVLRSGYLYDENVTRGPIADAQIGTNLYKYNSPLSVFDFIHVEDLFFAILSILKEPEQFRSGVFNIGGGVGIQIQELGDRVGLARTKSILPSRKLVMTSELFRTTYDWVARHDFWLDMETILSSNT